MRGRRVLAAAMLAAAAGCGEGTPSAPATPPATTATPPLARASLADLAGTSASRESGRVIGCREDVTAQVSLANRSASPVAVTGVRRTTRVVSGGCGAAREFVYARVPQVAGAGRTTLVMDEALFTGGSGCCNPGPGCDGRFTCAIEDTMTVLTSSGSVPAGSYTYQVNFRDCVPCAGAAAVASAAKPGPSGR